MASTATAPPAAGTLSQSARTPHDLVASAVDAVTRAYADVIWDRLPDPDLTWSTSRLADDNPRKLFHDSPYCEDVRKLKAVFTVSKPFSEVEGRYCHRCFPRPREQHAELKHGMGSARQRRIHADLLRLARKAASEEFGAELRAFQRSVPSETLSTSGESSEVALTGAGAAARAAYEALLREFNEAQSTLVDAALVENAQRYAAAALIARADREYGSGPRAQTTYTFTLPSTDLDLRLIGGRTTQNLRPPLLLRKPFDEFQSALAGGASLTEAGKSAVDVLSLPLYPHGFDWLPETMPVPAGASTLTPDDIAAIWRGQAHDVAVAAIDEWVARAQAVLDAYDSCGELTVVVPSQQNPARAEVELNRFAGTFVMRMSENGTERCYTVPAVVAAWFERVHHANAGTARLAPSGDNTAEILDTMARLREPVVKDGLITESMPFADALLAARGIHAAREVTGRSARSQVGVDTSHPDAEFASVPVAA